MEGSPYALILVTYQVQVSNIIALVLACVLIQSLNLLTAGLDYMETVEDLIFNSSVQHIVVWVPIVPDDFSEETEQFRASLSLVESNGINVTLSPEQATVNINDDEGISIMNSVLYEDTVHHYQREEFEVTL